jgi:hypothetical protein
MELKVLDRLMILSVLPKEGNIVTLRLRQDLIKKVGLSAAEMDEYEVAQSAEGGVKWNPTKAKVVNLDFSDSEKAVIRDALKQKDADKLLTDSHLSVWEMFVEGTGA